MSDISETVNNNLKKHQAQKIYALSYKNSTSRFPEAAILRCSENMQQIYRRTPMPKCYFIEIAYLHGCSPINLLYIFGTLFLKNTSE